MAFSEKSLEDALGEAVKRRNRTLADIAKDKETQERIDGEVAEKRDARLKRPVREK